MVPEIRRISFFGYRQYNAVLRESGNIPVNRNWCMISDKAGERENLIFLLTFGHVQHYSLFSISISIWIHHLG